MRNILFFLLICFIFCPVNISAGNSISITTKYKDQSEKRVTPCATDPNAVCVTYEKYSQTKGGGENTHKLCDCCDTRNKDGELKSYTCNCTILNPGGSNNDRKPNK
jgi:hypothetical protein